MSTTHAKQSGNAGTQANDAGPVDIHARRTLRADGTIALRQLVLCPEHDEWRALGACRHCSECLHVSSPTRFVDAVLVCRAGDAHGDDGKPVRHRLRTLARDRIVSAMDELALTVDADAPVALVARALRDEGGDCAVVVDGRDQPIGSVTVEDLACAAPDAPVLSAVSEPAIALLDRATVRDAHYLDGTRRQCAVPVLAAGRLVGVVTPGGLVAWYARQRAARPSALGEGGDATPGDGSRPATREEAPR